jgi:hypothetical protein
LGGLLLYGHGLALAIAEADSLGSDLVKRGAESREPFAQFLSWAADPEPEMVRHFEKYAGHNGDFVFLAQQLKKGARLNIR